MNIDYSKLDYFKSDSHEFLHILNEVPEAAEAYNKAKAVIDGSIFKDKAKCAVITYKNKIAFVPSVDFTSSDADFVRDNPDQWAKLFATLAKGIDYP